MMYQLTDKQTILALLGCIALGCCLQAVALYGFLEPDEIFWEDAKQNYAIALDMHSGEAYSSPNDDSNLGRAPGYPYFLSTIMKVTGPGIESVKLMHIALLPIFLCALFYAGLVWKNAETGIVAAALASIYPYFLYVPLTMYPESVLVYLNGIMLAALVVFCKKQSFGAACAMGLLISVSILLRPTTVIWIPVVWFVVLFSGTSLFSLKKLAIALLVLAIPLATTLGWMSRNYEVHGAFVFTTKLPQLLLNTYNENSRWDVKHPELPVQIKERIRAAETLDERQSIAVEVAQEFILNSPGKAAKIVVMQCLGLWNPIPLTETKDGYGSDIYKIVPGIAFIVVTLLALLSAYTNRRDTTAQALVLLLVANTILNGLFMISVRYRLIFDSVLILLCSAWLISTLGHLKIMNRDSKKLKTMEQPAPTATASTGSLSNSS